MAPHITDISKNQNIHPIDMLNYETNEQNFLIRVFKQIFDYILIHNLDKTVEEFLTKLFAEYDFDNDSKYSIGELNQFLVRCGIYLGTYDLRFLYESFSLSGGKILKKEFFEYFFELNQKAEHIELNIDFKKGAYTNQELKELEQLKEILDNNAFIKMINDSVRVFGKKYLIQYFKMYIENIKGKPSIDIAWLEIGYRKLGYDIVNNVDIGQFKFFCVKKKYGHLVNTKFNLEIEDLIDFLSDYYKLNDNLSVKNVELKTPQEEILQQNKIKDAFNTPLFNDISLHLSNIIFQNQRNEVDKKNKNDKIDDKNIATDDKAKIDDKPKTAKNINNNNPNPYSSNDFLNKFISNKNFTGKNNIMSSLANHANIESYNQFTEKQKQDEDKKEKEQKDINEAKVNTNPDFCPKLINEFFFRKNFLKYFKINDYDLMNHLINLDMNDKETVLETDEFGDYGNPEYTHFFEPHPDKPKEEYIHTKMPFSVKTLSSKKWLSICYNMMFVGMIQHYSTFGLMLDEMDLYYLRSTAVKIQQKLLVKDHGPFLEHVNFNHGVGDSQKILFNRESIQKDMTFNNFENSKEENVVKNSLNLNLSENEIKNTNRFINDYDEDIHFKSSSIKNDISPIKLDENYNNKSKLPYDNFIKIDNGYSIDADKYNKINLLKIKSNKPNIIQGDVVRKPANYDEIQRLKSYEKKSFDTNYCVSELYNLCLRYIREKTQTIDLNKVAIKKLGICTMIRDYFNKNGITFGEIKASIFYNAIKILYPDEIASFLYVFATRLGTQKEIVNVQYFLNKIEEVLILYSTNN